MGKDANATSSHRLVRRSLFGDEDVGAFVLFVGG
jgi:hypothetical protein